MVKDVFKRVQAEIEGIQEPEEIQKEALYTDFESIQKVLEKNLAIYVESQSAHETYQTLFHTQMESHSKLTDVMSKI